MSNLSPTTQALLRAARQDGPSAAGRAEIWSGVAANAAGKVALGAGVAGGKAAASAATAKLFVMGALLGSAVTVGVAAIALHVGVPSLRPDPTVIVRADADRDPVAAAGRPALPAPSSPAGAGGLTAADAPTATAGGPRAGGKHGSHGHVPGDSLGHEAQLVGEARGAIMRGEPGAALSALHAAQALPDHALEPEELSLEARALRAMGRLDEANVADARLRAKFPDHALAR